MAPNFHILDEDPPVSIFTEDGDLPEGWVCMPKVINDLEQIDCMLYFTPFVSFCCSGNDGGLDRIQDGDPMHSRVQGRVLRYFQNPFQNR